MVRPPGSIPSVNAFGNYIVGSSNKLILINAASLIVTHAATTVSHRVAFASDGAAPASVTASSLELEVLHSLKCDSIPE
jgi:hypothetical protein